MRITWIHGVNRLRGPSMSKWVDQLWSQMGGLPDLQITIDSIEGLPVPLLKGIINRYLLYSLHSRKLDSDLFHIHDHANSHLVTLLPKRAVKVVTVHDIYMLEQPRYQPKSYPFRLFNVLGIRRSDHIISVSEYMKGEIVRKTGYSSEAISVSYCGIDHSVYNPRGDGLDVLEKYGLSEGQRYLLFVGSEIARKNFGSVLEVFERLAEAHSDVCLLKVGNPGSGKARRNSLRRIRRLGLEEKVVFCGFVPEEDLPYLYSNASMLLAPSFYEGGSGMHVIEAMACGCPVVASNIPQSRELVRDAALICDPHDKHDILLKTLSLLEDEHMRRKMTAEGLSRACHFSWARTAEEHLRLYRELLGGQV